jgi:hypothetical protein
VKTYITLLIFVSIAGFSYGSGIHLGGNTKISKMRMSGIDKVVVYTTGQIAKATCATTQNGFVLTLGEGDLANRYYSTMLSAFMANKSVNMWCPDRCIEAYGQMFTECAEVSIQ